MTTQNFNNRTIFHGDNLDFLRNINSASVDLIATDPPFNKNKVFHAPPPAVGPRARVSPTAGIGMRTSSPNDRTRLRTISLRRGILSMV